MQIVQRCVLCLQQFAILVYVKFTLWTHKKDYLLLQLTSTIPTPFPISFEILFVCNGVQLVLMTVYDLLFCPLSSLFNDIFGNVQQTQTKIFQSKYALWIKLAISPEKRRLELEWNKINQWSFFLRSPDRILHAWPFFASQTVGSAKRKKPPAKIVSLFTHWPNSNIIGIIGWV